MAKKTLKLTSDFDIDMGNSSNSSGYSDIVSSAILITDKESLIQRLCVDLNTILGECYMNITLGIDYYLGKKVIDKNIVDSQIKLLISDYKEITQIVYYKSVFDNNNRKYSVKFQAETIYGNVSVATNGSM